MKRDRLKRLRFTGDDRAQGDRADSSPLALKGSRLSDSHCSNLDPRVNASEPTRGQGFQSVPVIATSVDLKAEDARANRGAWVKLAKELQEKRAAVAHGGPPKARERHLARGKLLPRERVMRLLDPGAPFLSSRLSPPTGCTGTRSTPPA